MAFCLQIDAIKPVVILVLAVAFALYMNRHQLFSLFHGWEDTRICHLPALQYLQRHFLLEDKRSTRLMFHDFQTASILRISHKYAYHGIDCRIDYGSNQQEHAEHKEQDAEYKEARTLFLCRLSFKGRIGIAVLLISKASIPFFAWMGAEGSVASMTVLIGAVAKAVVHGLMLFLSSLLPVKAAAFGTDAVIFLVVKFLIAVVAAHRRPSLLLPGEL